MEYFILVKHKNAPIAETKVIGKDADSGFDTFEAADAKALEMIQKAQKDDPYKVPLILVVKEEYYY